MLLSCCRRRRGPSLFRNVSRDPSHHEYNGAHLAWGPRHPSCLSQSRTEVGTLNCKAPFLCVRVSACVYTSQTFQTGDCQSPTMSKWPNAKPNTRESAQATKEDFIPTSKSVGKKHSWVLGLGPMQGHPIHPHSEGLWAVYCSPVKFITIFLPTDLRFTFH